MKRLLIYFSFFIFHSSFAQDTAFDNHVFNPKRFKVLANSITVTGVVEKLVPAPDGDVHIAIKLDSGQGNRINANNVAMWNGCLVAAVRTGQSWVILGLSQGDLKDNTGWAFQ